MFRTLRAKLVCSYILIVLLSLGVAGTAAGALLTRFQREVNLQRAQAIAVALAERLTFVQPGLRARAPDLVERLQRESMRISGRVLLLTQEGEVVFDSAESYVGQRVPLPTRTPRLSAPPRIVRHAFKDGLEYYVVCVYLGDISTERLEASYLGIAIKVQEIDLPWRELLTPLMITGLAVMALAVGLAFLLAHSITRPIGQMTRAAEEIARGNYKQTIRSSGSDEVSRLARSFTYMAQEVARAQQMQRDFLANISHDLKTPLTSIQGFAQAISEGAAGDEMGCRHAAQIIKSEADGMARLIQDLLELAQLEEGHLDVAEQPVNVAQLVRAKVNKARLRGQREGLRLTLSLPDGLPDIVADAPRLERCFANLLDNALKYSRPGGEIVVEGMHLTPTASRPTSLPVAFGQALDQREWVGISITNQADPIPIEALPHLFDRFYRGDRAREHARGYGLGLSIVREIVLAHGGRVEVSSDAERGTCFRVWLPVKGRQGPTRAA